MFVFSTDTFNNVLDKKKQNKQTIVHQYRKTLNHNELSQVADQRFSLNNGLLWVLILAGSEKLVLPIFV